MLNKRALVLAALTLMAFASAQAEFAVQQRLNGPAGSHFGWAVAQTIDIDGDGRPEILVGAPQASPNGKPASGSVFVYSGRTRKLIGQVDGTAPGDRFGQILCGLGDLNADGKGDFAVGLPEADPGGKLQAGSVIVYSSKDFKPLYQIDGAAQFELFGQTLCRLGDLDKDGAEDFAVGAPAFNPDGRGPAGAIKIFSGRTGQPLFTIPGLQVGDFLKDCAPAGDFNGDGTPDFAVGFPMTDWKGVSKAGMIRVYSGAPADRGKILFETGGRRENQNMGLHFAGVGDLDGDKKDDLLVGLPIDCHNGEAYIYFTNGKSHHFAHPPGKFCHFGAAVAGVGDADGDGKKDFVIGNPDDSPDGKSLAGRLWLISGKTLELAFDMTGEHPSSRLGFAVSPLGDLNGDRRAEFAVGVPYAASTEGKEGGQVWIVSFSQKQSPSKPQNPSIKN